MMDRGKCLILATVTSVKDSTVVYPSCSECYSRLLQDTNDGSFWCSSCHLTYDQLNVSFRYRLSVVISENNTLANVTAFGRTLQPFFGLSATSFNRFNRSLPDKCTDVGFDSSDVLAQALELCFVGKQFWFGLQKTKGPRDNIAVLSRPHLSRVLGNSTLGRSAGKLSSDMVASQMIQAVGNTPLTVVDSMNFLFEQQKRDKSICNPSAIKLCLNRSRSFRLSNSSTFSDKCLFMTPLTRAHNNSEQSCLLSCERDQDYPNCSNHESYISTNTSKRQDDTGGRSMFTSVFEELPGNVSDLDPNHTLPPEIDPQSRNLSHLTSQNSTALPEQSIEILRNESEETFSQNHSLTLDDSSFLLECDRMENTTSDKPNFRTQSDVNQVDISTKNVHTNYNGLVDDFKHLNEPEHSDVSALPPFKNISDMSSSKICSQLKRLETQKLKTNQCSSTLPQEDSLCSVDTRNNLLLKQGSQNCPANNDVICEPGLHVDRPRYNLTELVQSDKFSVICEELWDDWSGYGDSDQLSSEVNETKSTVNVQQSKCGEIKNSTLLPQNINTAETGICDKDGNDSPCIQNWDNLPESEDLEAFLCDYDQNMNIQANSLTAPDCDEPNPVSSERQETNYFSTNIEMSNNLPKKAISTCDNEGSQCKQYWENLPESEDLEAFICDDEHDRTKSGESSGLTESGCGKLIHVRFKGKQSKRSPGGKDMSKDSLNKLTSTVAYFGEEDFMCSQHEEVLPNSEDLQPFENEVDNIPSYTGLIRTEGDNIPKGCLITPICDLDFSTAKPTIVSCSPTNTIAGKPELPFKCNEDLQPTECDDEHSMDLFNSSSQDESCARIISLTSHLGVCSSVSDNSLHSPILETQATPDKKILVNKSIVDSGCRTTCRKGVTFSKRLSAISNVQLMDIRMRIAPNPTARDCVTFKSCLKRQSTVFVFDKIKESVRVETPDLHVEKLKLDHDLPYSEDLFTPSPILHRENLLKLPHSERESIVKKYSESTPLLFSQCTTSARKFEWPRFLTTKLSLANGVSEANYSVDLFASPDLFSQSQTSTTSNQSRTSTCNQSQASKCNQSDWIPPSTVKGTRFCKLKPIQRTSLPATVNLQGRSCVTGENEPDLPGEVDHSDNISKHFQVSLNVTSCSADLFSPELILASPQPQQSREFLRKNLFF